MTEPTKADPLPLEEEFQILQKYRNGRVIDKNDAKKIREMQGRLMHIGCFLHPNTLTAKPSELGMEVLKGLTEAREYASSKEPPMTPQIARPQGGFFQNLMSCLP